MKKAALIFCLFAFFASNSVFAKNMTPVPVEETSWKMLQNANVEFSRGNYGQAVKFANAAKQNRKAESEYDLFVLDKALSPRQVKKAGDEFDPVIEVLNERGEKEAVSILRRCLDLHGKEYFKDSVSNLLKWLKERESFPEAEYLIGKIYQAEGEYDFARQYFEKAREKSSLLDIPRSLIDILYSMAELEENSGKTDRYEALLLNVLKEDKNYMNRAMRKAFLRTVDADKEDGPDKFFLFYRAESYNTVRALFHLGQLYESRPQDQEKALECYGLACVEAFTHVFTILTEREMTYSYTTFSGFLAECGRYPDVIDWARENNVWSSMCSFASMCEKRGKKVFAGNMYLQMAGNIPDDFYRNKAQTLLIRLNEKSVENQ